MSVFNRTNQDRWFAGVLSLVVLIPTGWGLWTCLDRDRAGDGQHWISKLLAHAAVEVLGLAFLLSVLGMVWAVVTPSWMGRITRFAMEHLVWALAALLCVMVVFAWLTVYLRW